MGDKVCLIENKINKTIDRTIDNINKIYRGSKSNDNNNDNGGSRSSLIAMNDIKKIYNKRPDISFLTIIIFVIVIMVILYFIWPYLGASNNPIFSEKDYLMYINDPKSVFDLKNLGRSQLIIDSLERYFGYFKMEPYSLQAQGFDDIARGIILLPIISFLLIYIVPPFILLYVGWFVCKYFKYVMDGLWGWFLMIYEYGTNLIECQLASKWYIRFITGWSECSPVFAEYFDNWKRQYVDVPLYYETLKYVEKYRIFKEKYFSIPKYNYIDKNLNKLSIGKEFSDKTFIMRSLENFILKCSMMKYNLYTLPKYRFYKYLLEINQKLPSLSSQKPYSCAVVQHGIDKEHQHKEHQHKEHQHKEHQHKELHKDKPCERVSNSLLLTYKVMIMICTIIIIAIILIYLYKYNIYLKYSNMIILGLTTFKNLLF